MKMQEVKKVAMDKGIKAGKLTKAELIRTIQAAEGNLPCFQTSAIDSCAQKGCCWRPDCTNSR